MILSLLDARYVRAVLFFLTTLFAFLLIKSKKREAKNTFYSWMMIICGILGLYEGSISEDVVSNIRLILSQLTVLSLICHYVVRRIDQSAYHRARRKHLINRKFSKNKELSSPVRLALFRKILLILLIGLIFGVCFVLASRCVSTNNVPEAYANATNFKLYVSSSTTYYVLSQKDVSSEEMSNFLKTAFEMIKPNFFNGCVRSIVGEKLTEANGNTVEYYTNCAKTSSYGFVFGIVALFVLLIFSFFKKDNLYITGFLAVLLWLNFDITLVVIESSILYKTSMFYFLCDSGLYLLLCLIAIVFVECHGNITSKQKTQEYLRALNLSDSVSVNDDQNAKIENNVGE